MPPRPLLPLEDASDAYLSLQPTCSSSSSGITCIHADLDSDDPALYASDDPDACDSAGSDKEMEASDSMASVWTDSKHSSYLNFMEQNFVRDLYEREYCALDVCGQPSQHHRHAEETHDADSAESCFPVPYGPMEFKVWENGNWTWRVDSKRKMQPWTLLSNPWVKHFRTGASCRSDMSSRILPKHGQDKPQTLCGHHSNIPSSNPGMELQGDSRSRKRTLQVESEQESSMRRRAQFFLDEGSMAISVLGQLCERTDKVEDRYYYAYPPHCDG